MASTQQHQEIKAALERYTKEELVELMEHLLRIYVLNEPVKLDTAISKPENVKDLGGYSFSQIITYLQNNMEVDELSKFRVTPYTVYVSVGEAEFDLNGPTPTLASAKPESRDDDDDVASDDDDDEMTPAERMDALDNKPWRRAPEPKPKKKSGPTVETPTMADLFADDGNRDRGYSFYNEPPERAEEEEEELPPPIADVAPGDDPAVKVEEPATQDFAKAAATREEKPATPPAAPPPLAAGDTQINPNNRFASLDLD